MFNITYCLIHTFNIRIVKCYLNLKVLGVLQIFYITFKILCAKEDDEKNIIKRHFALCICVRLVHRRCLILPITKMTTSNIQLVFTFFFTATKKMFPLLVPKCSRIYKCAAVNNFHVRKRHLNPIMISNNFQDCT